MNSFLRSTICAASPLVLDGWRIATGCAVGSADVLPRHLPAALVGQLPISEFENAGPLLVTGGAIWLTNVIVFGLWYWEFDRGGPVARALGTRPYPDFQFVQMTSRELAPPDWEPAFTDYLYLAFTNASAFSPTDVMPLSRWAKLAMALQSVISIVTVALIVARAVNILK